MKITKKLQIVALVALSLGIPSLCSAQSDAPYTEGPVWTATMVKTKAGMTDEYLKELAKTLKASLEEAKKQNLVLDYKILLGNAATPQDFDILIMVESKNMAAQDNAREKFDPIARKVVGTTDQQQAIQVKRLDIREIIGTKLMREITLKYSPRARLIRGSDATAGENRSSAAASWRLVRLEIPNGIPHHSLKSPACSCVSITLPASS